MNRKRENEKPVKKFTEDEILSKLYGVKKKKSLVSGHASVSEKSPEAISQHIREEIEDLKEEINALEERLKKTEGQKERLKKKLVQRRFIDNFINQSMPAIKHKMPEKIIIIIPIAVIVLLFVIMLNLKQGEQLQEQPLKQTRTIQEKKKIEPVKKKAVSVINNQKKTVRSAGRKYTLQVAEYANLEASEKFVSNLEVQGFEVMIKTIYRGNDESKPYYKINAGEFETYNDAKKFKEAFFRATGIKDAFVKESR